MKEDVVTVVGSLNYDIICTQERMPVIGETYTCDEMVFCGGGKGANQATQLSKLEVHTYLLGAVGNDMYGKFLLDTLRKNGVMIDYIKRVQSKTGMGVVNALKDGRVMATIFPGANFCLGIDYIDECKELIKKSKIVILQLEIPIVVVEYVCTLAREYDCFIILNAAPSKELPKELFNLIDCFVVNETEASFYTHENINNYESARIHINILQELVQNYVIVTLGEEGSLLASSMGLHYIPPLKVAPIETTGAGDSYIGAFASQLLDGWNETQVINACKFATLASAKTIANIGAQDSMPYLNELRN